jgi:heme O synthase-like polyprenyltransferase
MSEASTGGQALAWRQLLRLGNVFTAASNVIAGFLIVHADWAPARVLGALVAASCCLYAAGMVLNDAFDAEIDARERPERPIPSGRIPRRTAYVAGWTVLIVGLALAALATALSGHAGPLVGAGCLALMIVMYDGGLKKTWAGPWAMGWCRALNVLLGGSLAATASQWVAVGIYAIAVGLYTVGLTMIASREAGEPPVGQARWGKEAVAVACGLLFAWPWTLVGQSNAKYGPIAATVGLFAFAVFVAFHVSRAARALDPRVVRRGVKAMLLGFVVIDACAAMAAAGWPSGFAVLALLVPTIIGARRAPMT